MSLLGLKVREMRTRLGLSQERTAMELDLNFGTLRKIERHGAEPGLPTLRKMVRLFRCSYDELIDDPMQKTPLQIKKQLAEVLKLMGEEVGGADIAFEELTAALRELEAEQQAAAPAPPRFQPRRRSRLQTQQQLILQPPPAKHANGKRGR